ncbi:MAG: ABC transporter permease [bacterium]
MKVIVYKKYKNILLYNIPGTIYIFIILIIIFSTTTKNFLSLNNFKNILLQGSSLSIIALGMSIVMLTNGIDLSVGSIISLVSIVIAIFLANGFSIIFSIFIGILIGCGIGFLNGIFASTLKLPPFIVTLGTMGIASSLALVFSGGLTLYWDKNWFNAIAKEEFIGLPVPFWIILILLCFIIWLFNFQSFGTYIWGVGNNEESLRLAGVRINFFKIMAYIICAAFAGVASIITTSRIASGNPTIGFGREFEAIAAAAIAGISFFGGKGHPGFAVFSGFTITILINGLSLLGLSTAWQYVGIGFLLIIGMSLNMFRLIKRT